MDLGYIAPCPVCGGEIKLYSHCGKPDCKAVCQSCKKGFPFHANLKTYAGTKIYASSVRKSVRMWNNTVSKEVIADDKEMNRSEFDSKVQENPLNDHLKVTEKRPEEKAKYDLGFGYLGNGLTVWNRASEVNGDYPTIAHISPEGEITYYVQDLPQSVVERIERVAKQEVAKKEKLPEFYREFLAIEGTIC